MLPDFPPTFVDVGKKVVKEALEEQGVTVERMQKIDEIDKSTKAIPQIVGPFSDVLSITADDTEFVVIDTSQIEKVANLPHGLTGWLDMSNFAVLGPEASIEVIWIIDNIKYRHVTYTPADFEKEPVLFFLTRRAYLFHKIILITHNTGVTPDKPLQIPYYFTLDTGFLPIPP